MVPVDQPVYKETKFSWIFLDEVMKTFPASTITLETAYANVGRRIHNDNLHFTLSHKRPRGLQKLS